MLSKLLSTLILGIFLLTPISTFAQEADFDDVIETLENTEELEDYEESEEPLDTSKTVQITSYQKTFNGDIIAYQSGSGTIIREDGIILTNHHLTVDENDRALDAFGICLTISQYEAPNCGFTADLIDSDKNLDIALFKINPEDAAGSLIYSFPFIDYTMEAEVEIGDSITIIGYPAVGGGMVTVTQGTVSGFETKGKAKHIKTDAEISEGNSGGTAIDENGNFIGIPTGGYFFLSGRLGYIIDINSVREWIDAHINNQPKTNNANDLLRQLNKAYLAANETGIFTYENYPMFELEMGTNWNLGEIRRDGASLYYADGEDYSPLSVHIVVEQYPFEVTEQLLEHELKKISKLSLFFTNYKQENTEFAGQKAVLVTFSLYNSKAYMYIIPYGHSIVMISYEINFDTLKEDTKKVKQLLKNFKFLEEKVKEPQTQEIYQHDYPAFSVKTYGGWRFQKNIHSASDVGNKIVDLRHPKNYEGIIEIYYNELEPAEKELSNAELLENYTKWRFSALEEKNDNIMIDGLRGWAFTYSYEGTEYQTLRKAKEIYLRNGDYYFLIKYDDLLTNYDQNTENLQKILKSFRLLDEHDNQGRYNLGSFTATFSDIIHYSYRDAINSLKIKGIVEGYQDNTFLPNQKINRAEAVKIILESSAYANPEKTDKNEIVFYNDPGWYKLDFTDCKDQSAWFISYLRYARNKEIISGYPDGTFHPEEDVTLAEALSILFKTYEIKTWADENNWTKPLLTKGNELKIIPGRLDDPYYKITRGEFAYMVDTLMTDVKMHEMFGSY